MSFNDSQADDVQPQEGQGEDGGGGNPAWASYLDRIPEEARGPAQEAFQEWDSNYQRTTQEAADYRRQWEPYEQAGVRNMDPEQVQYALQLAEAAQNPQAFHAWVNSEYAQHHGIQPPQQAQPQQDVPFVDEFGAQQFDPKQIEAMLDQRLAPVVQALQGVDQWRSQYDQKAQEAQIQSWIDNAHEALASKAGDRYDRERAEFEASKYIDQLGANVTAQDVQSAFERGWGDWQKVVSSIEKQVLQSKADQPKPPEGGGVAATTDQPMDAKARMAAAMEMIRNNQQQ